MNRNHMQLLIVVILAGCLHTMAFEVDIFKTGMSKAQVREIVNQWNFSKVDEKPDSILACDDLTKANARLYCFSFCDGRLFEISKHIVASPANFITMADKMRTKYGRPLDVHAESHDITGTEETNSISIFWSQGNDLIELNYVISKSGEQLILNYETHNRCF